MTDSIKKNIRNAIRQGEAVQVRIPGGSWQDADSSQVLRSFEDKSVAGHDQVEYRVKPEVRGTRAAAAPSPVPPIVPTMARAAD